MTISYKSPKIVLTPGKKVIWLVRLLESVGHNWRGVSIGVARASTPASGYMLHQRCGWFVNLHDFCKHSCWPHNASGSVYDGDKYGPWKEDGSYVHDGDVIGVMMDMKKGKLSFIVNGEDLGVAFSGIPTDEPLVPCVVSWARKKCSVEFISWDELNHWNIRINIYHYIYITVYWFSLFLSFFFPSPRKGKFFLSFIPPLLVR